MILVDTSVWVDHLRDGDKELACGHLIPRMELLDLLAALPRAPVASHEEALALLSRETLHATGLGAVDVHLLASARLARARLWSRDDSLAKAARKLGILARE
jgi:predicted nucleic acid-binding protein